MKNIVVGCPYTDMAELSAAIKEKANDSIIINANNVSEIGYDYIFSDPIGKIGLEEIGVSFIRYPYDLIPPHSGNYKLREKTEYLKSLSLLLEEVAINPVKYSWALRNRIYSLKIAYKFNIPVPESFLIKQAKGKNTLLGFKEMFIKATGNCFVSEKIDDISKDFKNFVSFEEDDGDFAAVFLAKKLPISAIIKYLDIINVAFVQEYLNNSKEYRGYYINEKFFFYERAIIDNDDKSLASYYKTSFLPTPSYLEKIENFIKHLRLEYLCFDLIQTGEEIFLIDVNPFGSMPKLSSIAEPINTLADFIIKKASNV